MATGQSDAPSQRNTPGQPDATVGHSCQSQMMVHFDDGIDVVMFDCLSNLSNFQMWPYISVCNTLHFCV